MGYLALFVACLTLLQQVAINPLIRMGRRSKKNDGAIGFLVLSAIGIAVFYNTVADHPFIWAGLAVLILVAFAFGGKGRCEICRSPIERKSHTWEIGGVAKTVCPTCNRNIQNKVSREAVNKIMD